MSSESPPTAAIPAAESETGGGKPEQPVETRSVGLSVVSPVAESASEDNEDVVRDRAEAVERILDQGVPATFFDEMKEKVETVPSDRTDKFYPPAVEAYLAQPENVRALNQLMDEFERGASFNDLLAAQKEQPDPHTLQALEVWSLMANHAIRWDTARNEFRTWEELSGEREEKTMLRVTEIVNLDAKALRLKYGLLSDEEGRNGQYYGQQCEALAYSGDIPDIFQERLREAADRFRATAADHVPAAPKRASEQPRAAKSELTSATEPKPRQTEKLFGKEVVRPDDIKAMSREVSGLLRETDKPESLFQAARELAYLKRAGIGITDPQKIEKVSAALLGNLEAMRQKPPLEHARYLGYLKYIGVLKEVDVQDEELLREELADWLTPADDTAANGDLAKLLMWQKYLKIQPNVSAAHQVILREDLKSGVENKRSGAELLLAQGRMKYLGIPTELSVEEQERADAAAEHTVVEAQQQEQWGRFVRLQNIIDFVHGGEYGGGVTPYRTDQEKIAVSLTAARNEASQQGRWGKFTAFLADAAQLSRLAERKGPLFEDELAQTLDEQPRETEAAVTGVTISESVLDVATRPASAAETVAQSAGETRIERNVNVPVVEKTGEATTEELEEGEWELVEVPPESFDDQRQAATNDLKIRIAHSVDYRNKTPRSVDEQEAKAIFDDFWNDRRDFSNETWQLLRSAVLAAVPEDDEQTRQDVEHYLDRLRPEKNYAQALEDDTWLSRLTSGIAEKLATRASLGGMFGIFTMFSQKSAERVQRARFRTVDAMRTAATARSNNHPTIRVLLSYLANEYELINLREILKQKT